MWWRFLTFCLLVCLILFVVTSSIHGRPVIHLFFQRCCEDIIENDQVYFESFGGNYVRERLIGADLVAENDNATFSIEKEEVLEMIEDLKLILNAHDPKHRDIILNDIDTTSEEDLGNRTVVENDSEEELDSIEQTTISVPKNFTTKLRL